MKKYFAPFLSIIIILFSCQQNKNTTTTQESELSKSDSLFYTAEGIKFAKQMYAQIFTHLNKALDETGPYESVKYCNEKALPLTDSLSKHFGITVKRTSLKLRNPSNAPNSLEKQILEMYEKTMSKKPSIIKTNEGIKFFTPIFIAPVCLNCHGIPIQHIPDVTMRALKELYPKDQATGYELYNIRGVWSMTFPNNYASKRNHKNQNDERK